MDIDYFRTLFAYSRWANARVLDRAREAREDDYFAERAGLSFKNLHGTLIHLVGSERVWLLRWTEHFAAPLTAEEAPDLATLLNIRAEAEKGQQSFLAGLTDADLDKPNTYRMPNGNELTHLLGHQFGHMVNHATQFRSEAAVRLTELDLSPGSLDFIAFLREQE